MNKKTRIKIPYLLNDCSECPKVREERTLHAGYAFDYYCTAKKDKKIMGYIEWSSELKEVPKWCPYRTKKKKRKSNDPTRTIGTTRRKGR